ncbi:MAG TPA: YXWGXW repeat-containing protein [Kofleriaceae bacterium]|nr:YXWGXW repeat-containing protein [Kofleriaceae bacterium]
MRTLLLLVLAACHGDVVHTTHAFVAPESCGQGPYDVHLTAEGKMGSEGVEVWACTPRRIAGHVEMLVDKRSVRDERFGDGADNGRCVGGGPVVATSGGTGSAATAAGGAPGTQAAQPVLVAQAFDDKGALIPDDACKAYGLEGMYLMNDTMTRVAPGADIDVRIWSDAPNDLAGVVFLVRHAISTHTRAEEDKEWAKAEKDGEVEHEQTIAPEHGAPPAPLAEERPGAPSASARWVPGYWTWTGGAWGWIAGFWREEGVAMPAPRVEVPGVAPLAGAVWIGGAWQLRAGAWIWVGGRWRGR